MASDGRWWPWPPHWPPQVGHGVPPAPFLDEQFSGGGMTPARVRSTRASAWVLGAAAGWPRFSWRTSWMVPRASPVRVGTPAMRHTVLYRR